MSDKKTILVTGGAGFIGSNIVDELINRGNKVIIIDNLSTGKDVYIDNKTVFYNLDLSSNKIKEVFENHTIDYVFHLAAQIDVQKSFKDPIFDAQNNILATLNLLNYCKEYKVNKIIYSSSAAVYGEPEYLPIDEKHPINVISPYGVTKHTPEHYLKIYKEMYDLDFTVLRYSNAYGPRQDPMGEGGVISIFVDQMIKRESPIIYGDGEQSRDFIFVGDIVDANVAALDEGDGEIINISSNIQNTINELHNIINDLLGEEIKAIYKKAKKGDIRHSLLQNNKALNVLNWKPKNNLKRGLEKTINYYKSN
jgi:UDP-glucose 4-epimerase